jgi:heat shock protein HtpX
MVDARLVARMLVVFSILVAGAVWVLSKALLSVFTRQRELVADRAAARATGSPASLAGALRRLDVDAENVPTDDLRAVASVGALSVVAAQSSPESAYTIWPGERPPRSVRFAETVREFGERAFRTHPPTERRCDVLRSSVV